MDLVDAPSSRNCYGLYLSYHCMKCGTYLHYYDSDEIKDDDWAIPELAKQCLEVASTADDFKKLEKYIVKSFKKEQTL